jgi:hypothetical protein
MIGFKKKVPLHGIIHLNFMSSMNEVNKPMICKEQSYELNSNLIS